VRHPLVEVLTAALFALCWALLPWERALAGMCFCSMLTVLALIDFDTQLLPDALNIALAAVGLLFSAVLPALHEGATQALWLTNSLNGIGTSLVGIFVGAGLVYWLRLLATLFCGREALGEGDIILLGGIGAFCGWRGAVFALFGGALLGAVVLSPFVLAKKICRRRIDNEQHPWAASLASCEGDETAEFAANNGFEDEVPFGPWLAIGAVAWFLYFRHPFALWLDNFSGTLVGRRTQSRADCMDATRM
jgi:leader peptidase (prepilin peptidase)/N-methyltransferase